ncbi:hypothetical protein PWEIH_08326 [Listeria weihenstephanensis FSL R9-0317]|uniref:Lipoprotein n=1 Tax=Listeria weihenstephanensis TaxID=1006155 RepID=A0A1S7FY79_9LIST|nr:hypothetical protein [Listeria weihenstephanensis]AQY52373.1 hypothetical protein UE46_16035 [Listeria weihenstephanensis]EUJ39028.1 hypothetical protein PWEIH_08326 [Listeria weihenstephanensis FSL R9-0317]
MNKISAVIIVLSLFSMFGCQRDNATVESTTSKNPTAAEILNADIDADIFQLNSIVYETNIDWVNELELTKNVQIGEIKTSFSKKKSVRNFDNGDATILAKGTKVFNVKERDDVLIVEVNGETKKYYALTEG